jgi:aminoglycoside phosphotransferase (APT) family kinase protein
MTTDTTSLVDAERLRAYLAAQLPDGPGVSAPFELRKHEAGYSNETFFIAWGERRLVLRRPPRGDLLPSSHDVAREFNALSGLWGTAARVPRPLAFCEDAGVIGAPFYVMERVEGVVVRETLPAAFDTPRERRRIGEEMVAALVELHGVDWQAAGMSNFGRQGGYLERQLKRWQGQIDLTLPKTRPLPGIAEIGEWLRAHVPPESATTVVHGDYKLDNVVFSAEAPARLVAILDWEMATLGDPLADLAWSLQSWGPIGDPEADALSVTAKPDFLTRQEMVALYEQRSGRSMRDFTFYFVLGIWKMAAILEGLYSLYLEGRASNARTAEMEFRVPRLVTRAQRVIDGDGV